MKTSWTRAAIHRAESVQQWTRCLDWNMSLKCNRELVDQLNEVRGVSTEKDKNKNKTWERERRRGGGGEGHAGRLTQSNVSSPVATRGLWYWLKCFPSAFSWDWQCCVRLIARKQMRDRQNDRQSSRLTERMTGRMTGRMAGKQTEWQTEKNRQTDRQTDRERQTGRQTDRQRQRQTGEEKEPAFYYTEPLSLERVLMVMFLPCRCLARKTWHWIQILCSTISPWQPFWRYFFERFSHFAVFNCCAV